MDRPTVPTIEAATRCAPPKDVFQTPIVNGAGAQERAPALRDHSRERQPREYARLVSHCAAALNVLIRWHVTCRARRTSRTGGAAPSRERMPGAIAGCGRRTIGWTEKLSVPPRKPLGANAAMPLPCRDHDAWLRPQHDGRRGAGGQEQAILMSAICPADG